MTLVAVIVLAVGGSTVGYAALSKSVTLSLDGQAQTVTAIGDTVGDVLDAEGIEVDRQRRRRPRASTSRSTTAAASPSGSAGRSSSSVDGEERTYWVTATDVASALGEIGRRSRGADLSASRGAAIDRSGMTPRVVTTPRRSRSRSATASSSSTKLTALTVDDVLDELGVKVSTSTTRSRPALDTELADGDKIVGHRHPDRHQARQERSRSTSTSIEREDDSMYEGEDETVRAGRDGVRDVTYKLTASATASRRHARSSPPTSSASRSTRSSRSAPRSRSASQLRLRQHRLGRPRAVRVRRQLGHQHRQRLLRRPPVQPRHLAGLRRHRPPEPAPPRDADRHRDQAPRRLRRLRRLAALLGQLGLPR